MPPRRCIRNWGALSPTIANGLDDRTNNSLNAVRLGLAYLVIISHVYPLGGYGESPTLRGTSLGFFAVGGFFAISGYLVTRSRFRSRFVAFAWRRFLRIVPGFWVALTVTALVIAPLVGAFEGGWESSAAFAYIIDGLNLVNAPTLIGTTLSGTPYPLSWNGSLWTIQWELACYVAVGVIGGIGLVRRTRWLALVAFLLSTGVSVWVQTSGILGPKQEFSMVLPFFLAGTVLYLYGDAIVIAWRLGIPAGLATVVLSLAGQGATLTPLCIAYLCLWAGAAGPAWARKVGARNDFSYGVYLYGFPVQMSLAALGVAAWGVFAYASMGLLVTTLFAAGSWFLVEKQALKLRLPRRGSDRAGRDPGSVPVSQGRDRSVRAAPGPQ
jgi:peptidoglycan/LPS O-acetylase OafA/YrhL